MDKFRDTLGKHGLSVFTVTSDPVGFLVRVQVPREWVIRGWRIVTTLEDAYVESWARDLDMAFALASGVIEGLA
ncbi:hypothetical protein [Antrihabitans cavernicola]|uniref:Uncharacterized protein n=1 Tax=Antrihabitans cavernicola TaxID=2495913 RepID=A0A5A7S6S1_9NOCA|nr:hypothetical protein [Spelaeibacter cavernicola]KAA0021830.1 hypothetical protein FOY51_15650 [Spelaeibacter cavernicola]